ncbi:hypothetical protein GCM10025864_20160 [Luteimicrobium album]|uniref:MFS transporter n=1 Tax=Luteimicrobium album TaxID=1054550 RepID=A0ABQ6I1Z6_9MICO|nr:hypothetical protein [Luteimicrobium album]GMA24257.1 hypothetical protein GCM10025864_20160 [Luteimicrobium album]
MSQQVGIALGTPVMSAVSSSQAARGLLPGIRAAVGVNGLVCLAAAVLVAVALRLPGRSAHVEAGPVVAAA